MQRIFVSTFVLALSLLVVATLHVYTHLSGLPKDQALFPGRLVCLNGGTCLILFEPVAANFFWKDITLVPTNAGLLTSLFCCMGIVSL